MKNKKIKASNTILGKDSEIEGNMKFIGTLTIEGAFKGNILGEGKIIIGLDGVVRANILASDVVIYGQIYGRVSAENKISVYSSGRIFGDVKAPEFQIEKGAIIKGKCITGKIDKTDEDELDIINTPLITHINR
ncbi:MAG: polymer-forming cytoskeletal protein [Desulfobacula sp.]|jgi:cytoskeletal protein CcmA (bactofilin family)|nr:polymer-forming cytoskeletal protein [Desulfobacula sp.]MBT6337790.1 polymer-forming cytoskeletal protein [Desulfobacula sp.]MBT7260564.1 polymer-forming cytoskeletal protein [Desulfobacula sp.]